MRVSSATNLLILSMVMQKADCRLSGADPGFSLGGGAALRNGVTECVFLHNTSYIRKPHVISGGGGTPVPSP